MHIRPLFSRTASDDAEPAEGAPTDYSHYEDDELIRERDRRQRQLEELTVHPDGSPDAWAKLPGVDAEIERITDELIRRARSRHPSSRGLDR